MWRFLTLAVAGSSFFLSVAASAAEPAGSGPPPAPPPVVAGPPADPHPARAGRGHAGQIPPAGSPILLEVAKGTLIRLPRPASTVFIANPDIADVQVKSPSLIYLSAKTPGETVLYAVDDNVLVNSPIRVEHDLTRLRDSFRYLMPGENVQVNSVNNDVVLSGNISTAGRAERARTLAGSIASQVKGSNVIDRLSIATPNQVNVRVRIAEVNRSVLKAIGVNWSKPPADCLSGAMPGCAASHFLFNTQNPVTGNGINDLNTISYGFALPGSSARLEATLDALAQESLLTTLAEPNLTATSGQTASFLAGGEFPVPVAVSAAGATGTTITIQFKTFGVALDFTPTIIDANHLSLRVRPEVSSLSSNGAVEISGFSIPSLVVRRAETTVELASGQTFALAGLLQNTSEQDISKIPGLGDIPVIGQLFRSDRFQRNETELVVLVTPYLVRPSSTAMAAPTDGFTPPHDAQRVLNGSPYRQGLPAPQKGPVGPNGSGLIGPAGFRID